MKRANVMWTAKLGKYTETQSIHLVNEMAESRSQQAFQGYALSVLLGINISLMQFLYNYSIHLIT
jgi:hypothetical protein